MTLTLSPELLSEIQRHGEGAYPEEGAGFLLGSDGSSRIVRAIMPLVNVREEGARRQRYLIDPQDYVRAESAAQENGLDVVGVFHSHPDHPDRPSEFDREWAQPHFSYLITSVTAGRADGSRSWRLTEDRGHFLEEELQLDSASRSKMERSSE